MNPGMIVVSTEAPTILHAIKLVCESGAMPKTGEPTTDAEGAVVFRVFRTHIECKGSRCRTELDPDMTATWLSRRVAVLVPGTH